MTQPTNEGSDQAQPTPPSQPAVQPDQQPLVDPEGFKAQFGDRKVLGWTQKSADDSGTEYTAGNQSAENAADQSSGEQR